MMFGRRSNLIATLGLVGLVAAGCSSSPSSTQTSSPGSSTPAASSAPAPSEPAGSTPAESPLPPASPVTLTVWDPGYSEEGGKTRLDAINAAFTAKYPTINIKMEAPAYDTYFDKFRAATAAGSGPDVVSMYPSLFAADYANGLEVIDDVVTPEVAKAVSLIDVSRAPDGKLYAIPFEAYTFQYFYNKKLFQQAGISGPPTTWEGLLDTCTKLRSAGIQPISGGWKDGYMGDWFLYIYADMLLNDDELKQLVSAQLPFNSPKMVQAITYLQDMNKAGCFADGSDGRTLSDSEDYFSGGKAAMVLTNVSLGKLEQYRAALGNDVPDVFYPPMLPGSFQTGQMVDFGPNNGWALTKWAQDRDAGILYLRFLLSKEAQQILGDNGSIPSNTEIVLQGKDPVEDKLLAGFALEGNRTTYMAMPASVLAIAERQTPAYVSGELSAQELMDQLEAAMAKLRPKYTR